jgi:GT2 family glycosyltransferase
MRIGIVTVTFNSGEVLPDFISSLKEQTYSNYILYAVDNASTDSSCALLQANLPDAVLIRNSINTGFAAGTNQGIRKALDDGCGAILLLNNDVSFGPDLIERLVEGIREFNCDMTAPMMYYDQPKDRIWAAGGTLQPRLGFRAVHRGLGKPDRGQYGLPSRITFAPFCCVLIRSAVFDQIGLLDEEYFTYAEDADFMVRCLKAGVTLWYVPGARLWHKVNSLTGTLSTFSIRYGARNRAYFIAKHLSWVYRSVFNVLYPSYYVLMHLVGRHSRQRCRIQLDAWAEGKRILPSQQLNCTPSAREPNEVRNGS